MDSWDRQIRYFIKTAELKSVSRAAESLDITQSGISRQLALLEAYLGKSLFLRTGRGVELTDAGNSLLAAAQSAYARVDEVLSSIRDVTEPARGTVRLATVHTLSYYFSGEVVAKFMRKREHVNLSILGRSSPEVVSLVESGKADLGFVYDTAVDSAYLTTTPLFEEEMCLFVPMESTLVSDIDLATLKQKLVGFPAHYALRRMLRGLELEFSAEAETVDTMLKLVSSGVGLCVLPSRMPERVLIDYQLRKLVIRKPLLKRRVVAIVRADRPLSSLVQELIQIGCACAT
ncbi:MAG TPA: LysR family transcriptional regulator [Bradyrhizobium sp.]|nr:LysR family transcriptional regulator [Bradyrhizobium sp.]